MKKFLHHLHEIVAYARQWITLHSIARTHLVVLGLSGLKIGMGSWVVGQWLIAHLLILKAGVVAILIGILSFSPINTFATAECGDSNLDTPEDCDDAGMSNGNGCSATCDFEFGDGLACDFDEICDPGENIYSCGQDCGSQSVCGNNVCEPEERDNTCPQDCGTQDTESCGNLYCDEWEDDVNCPMDCCTVLVGPFGTVTDRIGGCTDEIPGSVPFCHPCFGGSCPISGSVVTITCGYDYAPDSFETCTNGGIDDDGDGLADCLDSDCDNDPACGGCSVNADCDDGLFCNGDEVCNAGACEAGTDPCQPEETCNETTNICEAPGCVTNGDCNDGNVCNGTEICNAGECDAGVTLDCDDSVDCTIDSCDTQDGCAHTTDDSECDDGLFCNGSETCDISNGCEAGSDPCSVNETCDEGNNVCEGGLCSVNSDCDDGNVCNGDEVCNAGMCEAGSMLDCDDSVGCTIDTCDTQDGCQHTTDDDACDNGLFCDGVETCDMVNDCEAGSNPCSGNQTCNEGTNMCEDPVDCDDNSDCDNGDVCDGEEVCNAGTCDGGVILDCDDGVDCTDDSCDPSDGCQHTVDDDICDNGLYCDGTETCDLNNGCIDGSTPCEGGQSCNESNDTCGEEGDSDGDGVSDSDEQSGPNSGDANMDTIPDYLQSTVATVPTLNIDVQATLDVLSGGGSCSGIVSYAIQSESTMSMQDVRYAFPYGLQAFTLSCSSATVRIYFYGLDDIDSYLYRKYIPSYGRKSFPIIKSSLNDIPYVQFMLTDGGYGDIDGIANGVIVDPGGLGAYLGTNIGGGSYRSSISPEDLARAYGRTDPTVTYISGTTLTGSTNSGTTTDVLANNSWEDSTTHGSAGCGMHGDRYVNGYGACCEGMGDYVGPDIVSAGIPTMFCFDPLIGEPEWKPEEAVPGRYVPTENSIHTDRQLVLKDDGGAAVYKDYYSLLQQQLSKKQDYCESIDNNNSYINFQDIENSREKSSILALRYFCIIKGRGKSLLSFEPESRVSRAEFIKMLVRTLSMGTSRTFLEEGIPYKGETHYVDIFAKSRSAQYVATAHELGLLEPLKGSLLGMDMLYPNRSITLGEVTQILMLVSDGQSLSPALIDDMVSNDLYPTRGEIATILARKFLSKFVDYFYLQGNNYRYYLRLLEELRGMSPQQQYKLILRQIEKLQLKDATELEQDYDIHTFWAIRYLKNLMMYEEKD